MKKRKILFKRTTKKSSENKKPTVNNKQKQSMPTQKYVKGQKFANAAGVEFEVISTTKNKYGIPFVTLKNDNTTFEVEKYQLDIMNKTSVKKPTKQSSQDIATKASKTLRNDQASKISKSLAGSVLATRRKKGVEKWTK